MKEERIIVKAKARMNSEHLDRCVGWEPYTKTYRREFFKAFTDCPKPEVIDEYSMVADDKTINEIMLGERKVVVLKRDKNNVQEICDRGIGRYRTAQKKQIESLDMPQGKKEEKILLLEDGIKHFVGEDKEVKRLIVHNADDTISVTAEVRENDQVSLYKDQVKLLKKYYDCNELDRKFNDEEQDEYGMPATYYYFVLGDVIEAKKDGEAVEVVHNIPLPEDRSSVYSILDTMLSEEQQKDYAANNDHLMKDRRLRQWICNNWIYGMNWEITDVFEEVMDADYRMQSLQFTPKTVTDMVLDCYLDHLFAKFYKPSALAVEYFDRLAYKNMDDKVPVATFRKIHFFTKEEWLARRMRVLKLYPDFPEPGIMPVLDLEVDASVGKDLAEGRIPVWFEYNNDFRFNAMVRNEKTNAWICEHDCQKHVKFSEWMCMDYGFFTSDMMVHTIHFHDKENTWFVDVECKQNQAAYMEFGDWEEEDDVEEYQERYGTDYLKKYKAAYLNAMSDEDGDSKDDDGELPCVYFFVLGKVLNTNLNLI